jgi:hypothetical protein
MEDHDIERGPPRTRRPLGGDELIPIQNHQPPNEPKASSSTTHSQTPSEDEKSEQTSLDPVFEPIQPPQTNHRPSLNTIRTTRNTTSIHRTHSSNGYGCDTPLDEADATPDGKPPPNGSTPHESESEKDPFLVTWDGDDDPDNPRNMSTTRKWVITGIACFGGFAV